jgi:hypothetical protein
VIWTDVVTLPPPGTQLFSVGGIPVRLSPDGTLFAAATGTAELTATGTNLLNSGTLVTAVTGWPVGWLDGEHLIVDTYTPPAAIGRPAPYAGAAIYSPTGTKLGTSTIPEMLAGFQPLTADTIYSPEINSIFSVSSGTATWSSDYVPRGRGAVAGGYVIFASGARVLALPQ